jgi:hypothetical protein
VGALRRWSVSGRFDTPCASPIQSVWRSPTHCAKTSESLAGLHAASLAFVKSLREAPVARFSA